MSRSRNGTVSFDVAIEMAWHANVGVLKLALCFLQELDMEMLVRYPLYGYRILLLSAILHIALI